MSTTPVHLLRGEDQSLLSAARRRLVGELVGDADPSLVVVELAGDEYELRELIDAAQTPPFLTDHRVVVGRDLKRFASDELEMLLDYLADPLASTRLVLEWGGRVPKAVSEAVTRAGGESISTGPGRQVGAWVEVQLHDAGVSLDRAATATVVAWLGDEPGKLSGLLELLQGAFGRDVRLTAADVEPLLGEAGGVPPWDLTDAIDRGDIATALEMLHRMLAAGRHPMQVHATLAGHVTRLVRLDGAAVHDERAAAGLLGMKGSTYPAKKALAQARRLGHHRIMRSIDLVAEADLAMRGTVDWPSELVLEVLVARLTHLSG